MPIPTPSESGGLRISRNFNASKQLVFDAFASADAMAAWWGPKESPVTVEKMDFTPGGLFLYSLDMMGHKAYGRFIYHRIERPDLLKFTFSFSNADGETERAFFSEHWPLEVFNRISFEEKNGITTITLTGQPVNATGEELALYLTNLENMEHGFGGTFNQLEEYITKKQTK